MNGSIWVTSQPGEGSTFGFTIALKEALEKEPAETVVEVERSSPPAVRSGHILVAEDNLVNQRVITHLLQHLGYSVDIVSNGQEALKAACNSSYDAILMDCQMPEMSGYEAARLIRQKSKTKLRPPIIALTASAMSEDRKLCTESGMDAYISKPAQLETLAQVLDQWLYVEPQPNTTAQHNGG